MPDGARQPQDPSLLPAAGPERRRGPALGLAAVGILLAAIGLGSRNLLNYDPAHLIYTVGTLVAVFALVWRLESWLRRPPTRLYWRRGLELLLKGGPGSLWRTLRAGSLHLGAQTFIGRRGRRRWLAHFLLAWGTLLAAAVTFPLVFGWVHFESRAAQPEIYQVFFLGFQVGEFGLQSLPRYVIFNLLNLSAVMVTVGVVLALLRRLGPSRRSFARQQLGNDLVPLILLLAISTTGLMLTFSVYALAGYGYLEISLLHALTVALTLIYLPFGKFFHIFVRPLRLLVKLYQDADTQAKSCSVCGHGFAGLRQVNDLRAVLNEAGMDGRWDSPGKHLSEVCPRCRRRLLGACQGVLLGRSSPAPPWSGG